MDNNDKRKYHYNCRRYCAAFGCSRTTKTSPGLNFYQLPKNPERCRQWLKLIGREELLNLKKFRNKSYEICGIHFVEEDYITKKLLKNDALPSRWLGGEKHGICPPAHDPEGKRSKAKPAKSAASLTEQTSDRVTGGDTELYRYKQEVLIYNLVSVGTQTEDPEAPVFEEKAVQTKPMANLEKLKRKRKSVQNDKYLKVQR